MLPPYTRPFLSFADQVQLLKARGLAITNDWQAERHLRRIGYYRLKDYWYPFRATQAAPGADGKIKIEVLENFRPGTSFEHAVALYVFDKQLRMLMMDAIERIEVALRVNVAHTLGFRDPWAHRDPRFLDPKRGNKHPDWLTRADNAENRSRADWVIGYRKRYSSRLPVWMAVETWEFGTLSHLVDMLHPADRAAMSRSYGIPNPRMLVSWMRTISHVRNICAHHGRLWNHPLVDQPMTPLATEIPNLGHLRTYRQTQTRVYAAAAVAQHFLAIVSPNSSWKQRLKVLWGGFPKIPGINAAQAGFMPAWQTWPLWQ